MTRWLSVMTLLGAMMGCTVGPAETGFKPSSPAAFTGEWRSVTPSLEFIELSVTSTPVDFAATATAARQP